MIECLASGASRGARFQIGQSTCYPLGRKLADNATGLRIE
jgi:hypothetical protein